VGVSAARVRRFAGGIRPRRAAEIEYESRLTIIIFIGGAARTGKSTLTRRLLAEDRIPYLSLDVLKMGLARGVPEYAIEPEAGAPAVAGRMWPLVREMCASLLRDRADYAFEGELLPASLAALAAANPGRVRACFLGYATIAPAAMLGRIRANAGLPNDWSAECDDDTLLAIINREIAYSQQVRAECATHAIPYFDTSDEYQTTLDRAAAYLRGS